MRNRRELCRGACALPSHSLLTEVTVRVALDRLELSLEDLDLLAELGVLARVGRALGRRALERSQLLLGLDEVEENVEDAAQDERQEERRASQVDWDLLAGSAW